jgi:alpha-glucosidase
MFMQQAVYDAHQHYAPQQRVFILSRSAFAGSQRYGTALWSGDVDMTFAALRNQVALGLNVGLAGIPLWGSDIGGFGFGGRCTGELYARWFQFGAFCPLCRPHGDQKELREPWQFGPEIEEICRKYLRLRYRLLPYIYNAAYISCTAGIPIMRALVLDFPNDSNVVNLSDEYLFGPDILVAPVVDEGATERSVYLPDGIWTDFWTDELHAGPRFLKVHAPLDVLPLFIRQGAILAFGPDLQYSSERYPDPLTLEIYRGSDGSLTLYEDDGETTAYLNGAYAETHFEVSDRDGQVVCRLGETRGSFAGHQPKRTIMLNIHNQPPVRTVSCDDALVPVLATAESLEEAQIGWCRNPVNQVLSIKLLPTARSRIVRISS